MSFSLLPIDILENNLMPILFDQWCDLSSYHTFCLIDKRCYEIAKKIFKPENGNYAAIEYVCESGDQVLLQRWIKTFKPNEILIASLQIGLLLATRANQLAMVTFLIEKSQKEKWSLINPLTKAKELRHRQIEKKFADFDVSDNETFTFRLFRTAVQYNAWDIVKSFLQEEEFKSDHHVQAALIIASRHGHAKIIHYLLYDQRIDPLSFHTCLAFWEAIENGHTAAMQVFFNHPSFDSSEGINDALFLAVQKNNTELVRALLLDPLVDPSSKDNRLIYWACKIGNTEIALALLAADKKVVQSIHNGPALFKAIEGGHKATINAILKYPGVNASHALSNAFCQAVQEQNTSLAKALLLEAQFDLWFDANKPIRWACMFDNTEIVQALLTADEKVAQYIEKSSLFFQIIKNEYKATMNAILNHPGVNASQALSYAFYQAVQENHTQLAKVLLADHRVDPCFGSNYSIYQACRVGNAEIVQALLEDKRVSRSAHKNLNLYDALKIANQYNQLTIVEMILLDSRVNITKGYSLINNQNILIALRQNSEIQALRRQSCSIC